MANIIKTKAIVLKTIPFKESSLITSLLTDKLGKIKVLAKGIRRPKSKLCGTLEPFSLDEIIFYKREFKEMYTLSDASVLEGFDHIRSQPGSVHAAMVFCEFFDKTLPAEERDDESFSFFVRFLKKLQSVDETEVKSLVFSYLLRALSGAGVRPHIENCVRCHTPMRTHEKKFNFSINAGGLVCSKHYDDTVIFLSTETVDTIKKIYNNKDININNNSLREMENLIPAYLYYHLNSLVLHSLKHLR